MHHDTEVAMLNLSLLPCIGLYMGPNNLCYVTCHFLFFPYVPMSLFYKTLMSLSTVFIKGRHVRFLQLLKWLCCPSFFTHVEPFVWVQAPLAQISKLPT